MDWPLAISRNRDALRSIVVALFAMTGMVKGGMLTTLPRNLYLMTLAILRPAESAVRRLIVIAAQGLSPSRAVSRKPGGWPDLPTCGGDVGAADRGGRAGRKAFQLFDPLKSFDPDDIWDVEPQFESGFGLTRSGYSSTENDSNPRLDATLLGQRLDALRRALDTIPHQARRLARWQQRRDAALKAAKPTRISPMRPGLPPGWRERRLHEVDDVLRECHGLANDLLNAPDTS
jgi:hypothetical protein